MTWSMKCIHTLLCQVIDEKRYTHFSFMTCPFLCFWLSHIDPAIMFLQIMGFGGEGHTQQCSVSTSGGTQGMMQCQVSHLYLPHANHDYMLACYRYVYMYDSLYIGFGCNIWDRTVLRSIPILSCWPCIQGSVLVGLRELCGMPGTGTRVSLMQGKSPACRTIMVFMYSNSIPTWIRWRTVHQTLYQCCYVTSNQSSSSFLNPSLLLGNPRFEIQSQ